MKSIKLSLDKPLNKLKVFKYHTKITANINFCSNDKIVFSFENYFIDKDDQNIFFSNFL